MKDAEVEAMESYLDESQFEVTPDEVTDFSADELELEGTTDIIDLNKFESFDFGDFDF